MGLSKAALFLNGEEMMTWKIFILPELAIVQERLLITGMGADSIPLSISSLWVKFKKLEIKTMNSRVFSKTV